jgi:hypothetical protein
LERSQEKLQARIKASHGSMLLTLVSIVQGAVFSYLAFVLVNAGAQLDALGWLLAGATFVVIVLTWNEYFMGITSIVYVPDMLDSFFPFLMGVMQIWVVHSVSNDPRGWLVAMFGYTLLSSASFLNMYAKGIREPENAGLYAALRWHVFVSMVLPLAGAPGFLLLWWWVNATASSASLVTVGVYAVGLLIVYGGRTILYWKQIVRFATGKVTVVPDLSIFAILGPRNRE